MPSALCLGDVGSMGLNPPGVGVPAVFSLDWPQSRSRLPTQLQCVSCRSRWTGGPTRGVCENS